MRRFLTRFVTALIACLATAAHADTTVFNIFGPVSPGYLTNSGDSVLGPGVDPGFPNGITVGMGFTPSQSGLVTNVSIALGKVHAGDYHLAIYTDSAGVPGSVLATRTFAPPQFGSLDRHSVDFGQSVSLIAGQPYWLAASAGTSDWLAWNFTTSPTIIPTARIAGPPGSAPWTRTPFSVGAFSVDVAVPEPTSIASCAVAILPCLRRRRRFLGK